MSDPIETLNWARESATGVGLRVSRPNFSPVCASETDFDALVSSYYKFFHEELSEDVVFLRGIQSRPSIGEFTSVLKKLRTGAQHSGNHSAKKFYASWKAKYADDQAAAEDLAQLLYEAIECLAQNAVLVLRSAGHRSTWKEIVSTDVSSIMLAVVDDLGLNFAERRLTYMIRQVEQRLSVRPGTGSREATVQEYCVQELLSQNAPLPEAYFTVLDHLGLIGQADAPGAMMLAYSVAAVAPALRGRDFLDRVEETWRTAAAN